jgi:DNA-binding beta-propeller fold protein YncE
MKRFLWLALVVVLFLICTGCGDTFRPVIIPNPPKFPDPRASHSVMAINDNGVSRGSNMEVNVTGDSDVGVADMGITPVHAVQQSAAQVLVVNQGAPGMLADSLTKVSFLGTTISTTTTITLPPDSAPNFVATTESATAYVLLPGLVPPSVGIVSTTNNLLVTTIAVGNKPVAMVETVDKNKLYVANNGSSTVSGINILGQSQRNTPAIALTSPPVWLAARSDSQRVYVLEDNGTLATLDTTSNAGPDSVINTASVSGPAVKYMLYDSLKNRLYIPGSDPGSGDPQLIVLDVAPSVPAVLARVPLPAKAVAVAALPDGTRAYAASNGASQSTTVGVITDARANVPRAGTASYTFDPASVTGPAPHVGMSLTISGGGDDFDGTFIVTGLATDSTGSTFQVTNATSLPDSTTARTATGTNFFPQVTVINTPGNTVKTTFDLPAAPAAGPFTAGTICASTRFRFVMAAGGDSSRVYVSSCDLGYVNIIDTSNDTYLLSLPAPASARDHIPPSNQPPPQNPVFLIAGP